MRELRIGDVLPLEKRRGILGRKLESPVWHPLRVVPGKEIASVGMLKRNGIAAFVPTEDRTRHRNGQKITKTFPTVTQIIYAKFCYAPQWDVMRDRRMISGVFCTGNRPIILTPDAIRIVRGLPTRAEQIAAAREELLRVNAGERVRLAGGVFEGFEVDVTEVKGRRIWWAAVLSSGLPITGEVSRDGVEKLKGLPSD